MTTTAIPSQVDFLRSKLGRNWVLARRTPRIVARYGEDVVCVTDKRYREIVDEHRALVERLSIDAIEGSGQPLREMLHAAYALGREAR